jgi:hypothetical protein
MGIFRSMLVKLWGVDQPPVELAPPLDCGDCAIARKEGRDACDVHHAGHIRAHTHHAGRDSGLNSRF